MWNEMKTKKMYAFSCIHESIELFLFFSNEENVCLLMHPWVNWIVPIFLKRFGKGCETVYMKPICREIYCQPVNNCLSTMQPSKLQGNITHYIYTFKHGIYTAEWWVEKTCWGLYAEAGFVQTYPSQLPTGLGTATNITLGISCASWCKFVSTVYLVLSKSLWWKLHRRSWLGFKPRTSYILVQMP